MVGERAFRVDDDPGLPSDADIDAARAAGHLPDVIVGGRLVGDGPAEALEPVDVAPGEIAQLCDRRRLPRWVIAKNPLSGGFVQTKALMRSSDLVTVCEEAACPNIGRCWSRGTATFMIAGSRCTRGCRFCNVVTARPAGPPDPDEPARVAEAAAQMGLRFVVVTAVARDDLPDGGAAHFAACIGALRDRLPECRVEVLIPDLRGSWEALETIIEAAPDVLNHNTETVPRLYSRVRPGARYERTLELLARSAASGLTTKSGIMVGLGEEWSEVEETMARIREAGTDILTVGQYLRPSLQHLPITRFYPPEEFARIKEHGLSLGFAHVESGPLVRSSYHAEEQVPR
jgi:lipoic acid synthetase